jgi:WD40 repeat protein
VSKIVNISDVFISYSRRNTAFARQLNDAFINQGMKVWADWEEIPKGSEWRAEIQAGVEGADAFLFIISPDSAKSVECRKEIDLAVANRKRLVPVLHVELADAESKDALHPSIGAHNWIYAREADNWDTALQEILTTIQTDLDHVHAHTRLNVRAREWDSHNRDNSFLLTGKEIADAETWLVAGANKKPEPTQLHSDYIFASRAADVRRQRRILTGVLVALVVSIALTFLAVMLGIEANRQRGIAEHSAAVSRSVALASGAREATAYDQPKAVSLALEAVQLDDPPALTQRVLSEVAYRPGVHRVLREHQSAVTALAFSPDGTKALSGSDDKTVILWDVVTGEQLHVFEHSGDDINGVAFSPDGKIAAAASSDDTVILWDVESGEVLRRLEQHEDRVLALAFSPNGETLVSASRDETLFVWDVATGEALHHLEAENGRIFSVAFSPDGQTIVSGAEDGTIILWDAATGGKRHEIAAHRDTVYSLAFSPDGQTFASASNDRTLILWKTETATRVGSLVGHTRPVRTVTFIPDSQFLLSGGDDGLILLWDVGTEEIVNTFTGLDFISALAVSPDGNTFLANAPNGQIFLWDVHPGNIIHEFADHSSTIYAVAYSADGHSIASGSDDQSVVVSDVSTGETRHRFDGLSNIVNAVAFSPDGELLAAGLDDGTIPIWNLETGQLLRTIENANPVPIRTIAFSPDGKYVAGGDDRELAGDVLLWEVISGDLVYTFSGHERAVLSIAFSPDGTMIASASGDDTVRLWSTTGTDQSLRTFTGHTDIVESVVFTPDGRSLLSASDDQTIRLWDVETGAERSVFTGHTYWVAALAMSPNGQSFVSASYDDTILLWNIDQRDPVQIFTGHADNVYTVAFAPDGASFISGGENDGRVLHWRVENLPELIEWTRAYRYEGVLDCNTRRQFSLDLGDDCT